MIIYSFKLNQIKKELGKLFIFLLGNFQCHNIFCVLKRAYDIYNKYKSSSHFGVQMHNLTEILHTCLTRQKLA